MTADTVSRLVELHKVILGEAVFTRKNGRLIIFLNSLFISILAALFRLYKAAMIGVLLLTDIHVGASVLTSSKLSIEVILIPGVRLNQFNVLLH